jgi:hypothetical protein
MCVDCGATGPERNSDATERKFVGDWNTRADPDKDPTPLTEEWLLSVGFKAVESHMGPRYSDNLELGRLNVWELNKTGEWLLTAADHIGVTTRGELRVLAKLLKVELLAPSDSFTTFMKKAGETVI